MVDGRAKEVDAEVNAWICLGLAMPLVLVEVFIYF